MQWEYVLKTTEPAERHWLIGIQTRSVATTSSIQNCSVTHSIPKCCQSPLGDLAVSSTLPLHPSQIQAGGTRRHKANIIPLIFDVISTYGPHREYSAIHASPTRAEQIHAKTRWVYHYPSKTFLKRNSVNKPKERLGLSFWKTLWFDSIKIVTFGNNV